MGKVKLVTHPSYFQSISADITSRPSRVEIRARDRTFSAEKRFPKGTPSADPDTYMTTEELVRKFSTFVDGILPAATIDQVVDSVLHMEQVDDFGAIMRLLVRQ